MRRLILVLGLAGLVALSACEFPSDAVEVHNESTQTFILVEQLGSNRLDRGELGPGEVYVTRKECVDGDFIVVSSEGVELARRPGPFCQGEDPWIITDELLAGG